MIDIGNKLRKAYYQALTNNLTYNNSYIPVIDEKLESSIIDNPLYVLFTNQLEIDKNNKTNWVRECELTIRIVNQRQITNTKEAVENISSQILGLLFPSRLTFGITIESPLKLSYIKLTNAEYSPFSQTDTGFIISKNLTFYNRVIQ